MAQDDLLNSLTGPCLRSVTLAERLLYILKCYENLGKYPLGIKFHESLESYLINAKS